jgi:hypothetical protein
VSEALCASVREVATAAAAEGNVRADRRIAEAFGLPGALTPTVLGVGATGLRLPGFQCRFQVGTGSLSGRFGTRFAMNGDLYYGVKLRQLKE